jgi:hemolysin activation/secretion protein
MRWNLGRVALLALAIAGVAVPARALVDANASTFEGAASRYRYHEPTDAEIPVPPVAVKPEKAPSVPDTGPGDNALRFSISRFDVVGNTLIGPSQIDETLTPFLGEKKTVADVQKARDALQQLYSNEGYPTVAVTLPQQTISGGIVRIDVLEARLDRVTVENPGVKWFSDESVLALTPHLKPGVMLRDEDLQEDLTQANNNPDRKVRPVLRPGAEAGTVDLELNVEDRIPLHGEIEWDNNHPPGTPIQRLTNTLSYGNLWGLEHSASVSYQYVPNQAFHEVQIVTGAYSAPMPWSRNQTLFAYAVYSNTTSSVVNVSGLGVFGNGVTAGVRYLITLPQISDWESYHHTFSFGLDRKDVTNTLALGNLKVTTPLTYLPFTFGYTADLLLDNAQTSVHVALNANLAGTLPGGSKQDFILNRPAPGVDGNYVVGVMSAEETIRVPALLEVLSAGRFHPLPRPASRSFLDDWTIHLIGRGQIANQPLVSTEQFPLGGLDSVRGYLQSSAFGDDAWNFQTELRTPGLRGLWGWDWPGWIQAYVFYDTGAALNLAPAEGQSEGENLSGYGVGLRAGFFDTLNAEVVYAHSRDHSTTSSVAPDRTSFYFRLSAGF